MDKYGQVWTGKFHDHTKKPGKIERIIFWEKGKAVKAIEISAYDGSGTSPADGNLLIFQSFWLQFGMCLSL